MIAWLSASGGAVVPLAGICAGGRAITVPTATFFCFVFNAVSMAFYPLQALRTSPM